MSLCQNQVQPRSDQTHYEVWKKLEIDNKTDKAIRICEKDYFLHLLINCEIIW